jgi:chromosome segregation ATPase
MSRNAFSSLTSAALFTIGLAVAVSAAGVLGGCASNDPGRDRSAKAVSGLRDTRAELAAGRAQLDKTLAALDRLQAAQGDLRPAYDDYKDQVKATEDHAKSAAERSADMQARAGEYQQKWAEEMAQVSDPNLKAAAESRAAKLRGRYATITAKAQDGRAAYQPYIRDLKEIQTYLSNDLTPAAIQAAGPAFKKAKSDGQTVRQKLDAVYAELDAVAIELSPGAPAK